MRVTGKVLGDAVVGPFVLTPEEQAAHDRLCSVIPLGLAYSDDVDVMMRCVRRAQFAPAAKPLSDELRALAVAVLENDEWGTGTPGHKVAAELLRRCPAPPPKQRTPEELAEDVFPYLTRTGYAAESLQALVALAKGATK